MHRPLDSAGIRRRFPGLLREVAGRRAVFFDGPAGSQVPQAVADATARWLLYGNANHGGAFATSVATDEMLGRARAALADLLGAGDPDEIVFGANMTTLTLRVSRALARTWRPGDEVVVTDADHDANVMPWVLAARDAGAAVRRVAVRSDGAIDRDAFARLLGARTRLCAFGAASNLLGTLQPVGELCALARRHGALTFVDAVHLAPHGRMDVAAWGCDFAVCSAYKFFGPHVGVLFGRAALLAELEAYKVRPAADRGPGKWESGTANFEGIAGSLAAVEYLAEVGRGAGATGDRRACLDAAFAAIGAHERALCARLLDGLRGIDGVRVLGIDDPERLHERCATVALVHRSHTPRELCLALAERGVFTWAGHSYALALADALGLLPEGALRAGILHYHDESDVDGFLDGLRAVLACAPAAGH